MAEVASGLEVDAVQMRANLEATRGVIFAERVMMMLGPSIGRDVAHQVLEEAARNSVAEGRRLVDVLAGMPDVTRHIPAHTLATLDTPEDYLGAAETFRRSLTS